MIPIFTKSEKNREVSKRQKNTIQDISSRKPNMYHICFFSEHVNIRDHDIILKRPNLLYQSKALFFTKTEVPYRGGSRT